MVTPMRLLCLATDATARYHLCRTRKTTCRVSARDRFCSWHVLTFRQGDFLHHRHSLPIPPTFHTILCRISLHQEHQPTPGAPQAHNRHTPYSTRRPQSHPGPVQHRSTGTRTSYFPVTPAASTKDTQDGDQSRKRKRDASPSKGPVSLTSHCSSLVVAIH